MPKLEGIIYKAFGNYVVLRGFAPIGDIAKISKKPDSYQRNANEHHKKDIIAYLDDVKAYFPEVTLACRTTDYEGLIGSIGNDKDISSEDSRYVSGLRVLKEYIPQGRDRARHAFLELKDPTIDQKLTRVDGNHRLEPFSSRISWWSQFVNIPENVKNEVDEEKKKGWIKHQASEFKKVLASRIIPFTIIISDAADADNFEAKIFHDINFKQLPLRQEASLRIISELQVFEDTEKLGAEYPLTLKLIETAKTNSLSHIFWLKNNNNIDDDYYRTACLRITQLLLLKKSEVERDLKAEEEVFDSTSGKTVIIQDSIKKIELANVDIINDDLIKYNNNEIEKLVATLRENESSISHIQGKIDKLTYFVDNCDNIDVVISAIHSLRSIYDEFPKNSYGNIALLCSLIYYSILDKIQLRAFVNWIKRNGISRITEPDDLIKDSSNNLISMFEEIYKSKKSEIFISMQFGDSQSELIYEKVIRAIEEFNKKHQSINLRATSIRIDRTVEANTYTIQDRILDAINSCSLIIADLSSSNINVYHEIGYAMGVIKSSNLQANMILLYKEDSEHNKDKKDIDKFIGFNLRSLSQLRFSNYKELTDGLIERLEKHFNV